MARRDVLLRLGGVAWLLFLLSASLHIFAAWREDPPAIFWLLDWHVYFAGARDLLERDLFRTALRLDPWFLPTQVFNMPPGAALLALPLWPLGRELGGLVWLVLGVAALSASAVGTARLVGLRDGWAWMGLLLFVYSLGLFFPVHVALGNVNFLLLAVLVAFTTLHLAGRQRAAGILLGSAISIKVWPIVIGIVLIRERRWQELRWALGLLTIQTLAFVAWLGPDVLPHMVDALRTPIPSNSSVTWTSWLREALDMPAWIGPAVGLTLLLIPLTGAGAVGLGLLAGISFIANVWDHYVPTIVFAGALILVHLRSVGGGASWQAAAAGRSIESESSRQVTRSQSSPAPR